MNADKPLTIYTRRVSLNLDIRTHLIKKMAHLTYLKYVYKEVATFFRMKSKPQGGERSTHSRFNSNKMSSLVDTKYQDRKEAYIQIDRQFDEPIYIYQEVPQSLCQQTHITM